MHQRSQLAALQAALLGGAASPLRPGARVLDLGCGNGDLVQQWLDFGYDAHGCDFKFKRGSLVDTLQRSGRISLVEQSRNWARTGWGRILRSGHALLKDLSQDVEEDPALTLRCWRSWKA